MPETPIDYAYAYARPSSVELADGRVDVRLATSGGVTQSRPAIRPIFFDGFLGQPEQTAQALLAVAHVARTRFYTPANVITAIIRAADPVVTSNRDRLRFESFSVCCGVYARLDLLEGALDGTVLDTGTTNVDFNAPMRAALAQVGGLDPLHMKVGEDVVVTTLDAEVTEEKVKLPYRWLKGLAEVQVASSRAEPVLEVDIADARRLIRANAGRSGRQPVWVTSINGRLRVTSRAIEDGVPVSGLKRLSPLVPLLRFARALRVYRGPHDPAGATSVWELELDDARFVLALSPEISRGFSAEGAVLADLADPTTGGDADLVSALLAFEPRIDVDQLAAEAALTVERVRSALVRLSAAGRVGFDVAEGAYFHRELPYEAERLEALHPRLRDARKLVASGAVALQDGGARVRTKNGEHLVRYGDNTTQCTCLWFTKHGHSRGPCTHLLAVHIVESER